MNKMGKFLKWKKGFTLVELIAVMAIMAIASALVLPNIRGMIDRTEETKIKSYCVEASTHLKNYTNLLLLGVDTVPYEKNGVKGSYTIKDSRSGLQNALNEYNLNKDYQYYVVSFVTADDTSPATTNPVDTIRKQIKNNKLEKKDVMITCIEKSAPSGNSRSEIYTTLGFWFYSYSKDVIVYYYYVPNYRCGEGFSKLTKDGK